MKKYLLFAGQKYYPLGGMSDYIGDFDTIEQAKQAYTESKEDWGQIVDYEDMKAVEWL